MQFDRVKNAWARRLTTVHFYHGPVTAETGAKWITVEDCRSLAPVSLITGGRRYPYNIDGQLVLMQRCFSSEARHAFVFGARVPGPNVFFDCRSERDYATSEPHHRWSVGGLYDNITARLAILQGGSGITYRAEDTFTERQVALKELSLKGLSDWKKHSSVRSNSPAMPRTNCELRWQ